MHNKILVPLDGSKTAEKVLPCARYLAAKFKVPLELLTAIDIAEIGAQISPENTRFLDTMITDGLRRSEDYLRTIAATFHDVDVKCTVEKGRSADTIIEKGEADKAMIIAMATHGRSGLDRFLLGSVAEKVLRGSANPLLLVRATEETKAEGMAAFRTIIVPLDGSEVAEKILPEVADMAKVLATEVILFRAYHVPYTAYAGDEAVYAVNYDEMIAGVRDEANEYIEKKAAELRSVGVASVSCLAKEGLAGDEIIALGNRAPDALIAMCSHGRSGVKRWVLGSITETVVRHSNDPVLVLRAG